MWWGGTRKGAVPEDGEGYTVMTMAKSSFLLASPPCLFSHCHKLDAQGRRAGPQLCLWAAHENLMVAPAKDLVLHQALALMQSCEQHVKFVSVFIPPMHLFRSSQHLFQHLQSVWDEILKVR